MKKIIHMSDLHVGHKDLTERFHKVSAAIKDRMGARAGQYVIIITGDLVENANKQSSRDAVKAELDILKEAGFTVLVVPGNHDYGTGDLGDKKFVALFKGNFYGDTKEYPRFDIIGGAAFFGLDSMGEEVNWHDRIWAEGELGDAQLARLDFLLRSEASVACAKRVIYLHHHPFDARPFHELRDSRKLKKILTRAIADGISVDALLYGHNHAGKAHNGSWGIVHCYDAGSTTLKSRPFYLNWMPWFKTKSFVREINLDDNSAQSDCILQFV